MSFSSASRLLRPSGSSRYDMGFGVHPTVSHGLHAPASQRSESQRSSQDEAGTRSVRSTSHHGGCKPSLLSYPSASPFAAAEHIALTKRVTDQDARIAEQSALIKRLEAKLDRSLEAQGALRAKIEHDLATAMPEMAFGTRRRSTKTRSSTRRARGTSLASSTTPAGPT